MTYTYPKVEDITMSPSQARREIEDRLLCANNVALGAALEELAAFSDDADDPLNWKRIKVSYDAPDSYEYDKY